MATKKQNVADTATIMKENHKDVDPKNTRSTHVHHEPGGIISHCDDSDCEAECNHMGGNLNQSHEPEQLLEFVPDSAASSSGFDRQHNEILRSMHPMRKYIVGDSDDICLDTSLSSVQGINSGQPATSPWLTNNGNLLDGIKPLKDLFYHNLAFTLKIMFCNWMKLTTPEYLSVGDSLCLDSSWEEDSPAKMLFTTSPNAGKPPAEPHFIPGVGLSSDLKQRNKQKQY